MWSLGCVLFDMATHSNKFIWVSSITLGDCTIREVDISLYELIVVRPLLYHLPFLIV